MKNAEKMKCIKMMGREDFNFWKEIRDKYYNDLNARIPGNTVYTLHDYDHHCQNIYDIISNILISHDSYYKDSLESRDLLLLNVAVLLHDISMHDIEFYREDHGKESAEKIDNDYYTEGHPLSRFERKEILGIERIVRAHTGKYNIQEIAEGDEKIESLAAVLRFADALDVTANRGDNKLKNNLKGAIQKLEEEEISGKIDGDKEKRLKGYRESLIHWEMLELVYDIKYNTSNESKIMLFLDEEKRFDDEEDFKLIKILIESLLNEFNNYSYNNIFSPISGICIKKIKDRTIERILFDYIKDYGGVYPYLQNSIISTTKSLCPADSFSAETSSSCFNLEASVEQSMPIMILKNEKIDDNEAYKIVSNRSLLNIDHYKLYDNFCAREWINTDSIIENQHSLNVLSIKLGAQISEIIAEKGIRKDDVLIVGIDSLGSILATKIAINLIVPFSYLITEGEKRKNGELDQKLFTGIEGKNIVLISDVIATYSSIENFIDKYFSEKDVLAILSIYYRMPKIYVHSNNTGTEKQKINDLEQKIAENRKKFASKHYVLHDKFDIEIIVNEKCRNREACTGCNISK